MASLGLKGLGSFQKTYCLRALFHLKSQFSKPMRHYRWVPQHCEWPNIDDAQLPEPTKITVETASLLERLSLVDFQNQEAVNLVEEAIRAADELQLVNTDNVAPKVSLLEDESLYLREDEVNEGGQDMRDHLLSNSSNVFEDYWTAPPGNLPILTVSRDKEPIKLKSDGNSS